MKKLLILRADEQVYDPKHGGVCVGGIFCICQDGWGHKSPLRGLSNHVTENIRTRWSQRPQSAADSIVLECGCRVMKGWRCQFHGAP